MVYKCMSCDSHPDLVVLTHTASPTSTRVQQHQRRMVPEVCGGGSLVEEGQEICFATALRIYKRIVYGYQVGWRKTNRIHEEAKDPASYSLVLPLKDYMEVIKVEKKKADNKWVIFNFYFLFKPLIFLFIPGKYHN